MSMSFRDFCCNIYLGTYIALQSMSLAPNHTAPSDVLDQTPSDKEETNLK